MPVLVPFNLYIEGSYFGDSDILVDNQKNIRDSTAIADVRSELLVITRLELLNILEKYKKIDKEMRLISKERKKHHNKAISSVIDKNKHKLLEI
jgi:CRP-like cAMP-binding protein